LFSRVCPLISAFLIPKKQTVFLRMFSLRVGAGKLFKNYRCLIRFGTTTDGGSLILIHMEEEDNRRRGGEATAVYARLQSQRSLPSSLTEHFIFHSRYHKIKKVIRFLGEKGEEGEAATVTTLKI
jgi:hypothetical protein